MIIIAIFKIKAYSRMNGTNLHSPVELQPEMHAESHLEEHPSSLYIAQVKQKCGIIERENYNKPKSEDAKQPQCPPDKEKAIKEALKHFGMS